MKPFSQEFPKVTVVTPSYQQAAYLERTIRSVLDQDYPNLEYIVIDGGSTDGSREVIERYADRLAYWVSVPDAGQTHAINKGFNRGTGEVFAWLNSDDTYEPGGIRRAVEALRAAPDCSFVYGDCSFIDADDRVIGRFNAKQTDLNALRRGSVHIPQQAFFFRAELWERVGPLDQDIWFAMDYDLWLRLAAIAPYRYFPGAVWANFRLHADAKTIAADERCWRDMLTIHYRDGGKAVSLLTAKYWIRKALAPLVTLRRRRLAGK